MEEIVLHIVERLRAGEQVDDRVLVKLIHAAAKRAGGDKRAFAKRRLLPFYQRIKTEEPERWTAWDITPDIERKLVQVLRMKPRRSASGVATITVITKPWPCSGSCRFCPSDLRMPKSYLADEPACERAAQNAFDPYLQVSARLTALAQMGHATDKIELIVLGGTWSDYPEGYQIWFIRELFRALNDGAIAGVAENPLLRGFADEDAAAPAEDDPVPPGVRCRRAELAVWGILPASFASGSTPCDAAQVRGQHPAVSTLPAYLGVDAAELARLQAEVNAGATTYNAAVTHLFGESSAWRCAAAAQTASLEELEAEQRRNEDARHRVVGLVIETRPDAITPARLALIRRMGATKIQMGVQSTCQRILDINGRNTATDRIARSFSYLRLFGFKIHAHAMVNLLGADPAGDKEDYRRLVTDPAFMPDEVKLYPCALIDGAALCRDWESGAWRPYAEDELIDVLCADVRATPAWTRVSRMIRDFSSGDIKAGNKKPNLRQLVEERLRAQERAGEEPVREIRFREIGTHEIDVDKLVLDEVSYCTQATDEHFLQWVDGKGRIAGFLRLSLPHEDAVRALAEEMAAAGLAAPVRSGDAMIREVHVYGMAERVGEAGAAAQHRGLGRDLVERACAIAHDAGFMHINVISSVGTRAYYRRLGFVDCGLYQRRDLTKTSNGAHLGKNAQVGYGHQIPQHGREGQNGGSHEHA